MREQEISPTHAGAVIVKNNGKIREILLSKRIGGKVPGYFLTQGHIEKNETAEKAVIREIAEETGIKDANLMKDLGIISRKGLSEDNQWYQKVIHFFLFQTAAEESSWTHKSPDNKAFRLQFFPLGKALSNLYFEEEKNLLSSAIT